MTAPALTAQSSEFDARVVEDSTGNPLASAEIRFHKTGQRELAADLDTDRQGRVQASGLAPGDYTIDVIKPNYVTASLRVRVPSNGTVVRLVRYAILSGQVTDSQGQPALGRVSAPGGRTVGGARIAILAKEANGFRKQREVELGEEGRYRIYDLTPGEYAIGLWYDGLRDGSGVMMHPDLAHPRIFSIAGGEEFRDVNFQLMSRTVFKVSGTAQLPKPKTRVALALGLPEQPLLPIAQTVTDGDSGAFTFERVPPGVYELYAAAPDQGYGAHESMIGPDAVFGRTKVNVGAADVTGIDLALAPAKSVMVKLAAGSSEKPPEGCPQSASVSVELMEPWGIFPRNSSTQVGFGKEQTLRELTPGRMRLVATGLGNNCFATASPVIDLSGDVKETVTLQVASAGSIRGMLRGGNGATYTVVLLDAEAQAEVETRLAKPDGEGRFSFEALRPGRYRIGARVSSADPKARWVADLSKMIEVQIPGGVATDVELPAPATGGHQ